MLCNCCSVVYLLQCCVTVAMLCNCCSVLNGGGGGGGVGGGGGGGVGGGSGGGGCLIAHRGQHCSSRPG